MEYYAIVGMVVICLIALFGFNVSLKKSYKEDVQQFQSLNENIIKLNANFEHMLASDKVRDDRIGKHGSEIDKLAKDQDNLHFRVGNLEKVADRHEQRISNLEER